MSKKPNEALQSKPVKPVPKWSEGHVPEHSIPRRVHDNESWETLAKEYGIDAKKIIEFNFKTSDPRQVNWYLGNPDYVGCTKLTRDGNNWMFSNAANPGFVYIPATFIEFPEKEIEGEIFCKTPTENYPYRDETFAVIASLAETIKAYSKRSGVPPVAVAGSIADEYNTRKGVKGVFDWFQDSIMFRRPFRPWNWQIEISPFKGYKSGKWGPKLLNYTQQDLGKGNIKLDTAKEIYERYKKTFPNKTMDWIDLAQYIISDEGMVHVAALVIERATEELDPYLEDYPEEVKEAVYVSYYKEGPGYLGRFLKARKIDPNRRLKPGDGCRVLLQRDRFLKALKIE